MKPCFSKRSFEFLEEAERTSNRLSKPNQKQQLEEWFQKKNPLYQEVLVEPFRALMQAAARELAPEAPGYRFPKMGFARIRSSEGGFRNWIHVSVSRDSGSRYESCPNLYFHFSKGDVYTAGGLFMPSADQTKHIRRWVDADPSELEDLLNDREFKKVYAKGLGTERVLKTKPRDYPIDHPRMKWLKLSGWYVWRPLTMREALSSGLDERLVADWKQVLRLNRVLDRYTQTWPESKAFARRLEVEKVAPRVMDF